MDASMSGSAFTDLLLHSCQASSPAAFWLALAVVGDTLPVLLVGRSFVPRGPSLPVGAFLALMRLPLIAREASTTMTSSQ